MKPKLSERALNVSLGILMLVLGLLWGIIGSIFFVAGALLSAVVFSPYKIGHITGHKLLIEALEALKRGKSKQGS